MSTASTERTTGTGEEATLSSIDRALIAARIARRPRRFVERYLPEKTWLKWYDLAEAHTTENPMSMILVHPGSGKSTKVGFIDPLRWVCKDREVRIGYFSKTAGKASLFMQSVGRELRGNDELIEDYGRFYDPYDEALAWSTEKLRVIGSDRAKPTPTFINVGATSQIESLRFTHLILDDPIDLKTSMSQAETSRMDKLFGTLIDRLDRGGRLVIIGHRFLPSDFYQRVIDTRPEIKVLILPAYHAPGDMTVPDENGVPLVPEIWPHPSLLDEKKRHHRGYEWLTWYMQQRVSPEDSTFHGIERQFVSSAPGHAQITAAFDPAYSTSEKNDWSVGIAGCPYEGGILVTAIRDWRISQGWASRFVQFCLDAGARRAFVEINNARTLGEEMRRYSAETGAGVQVNDYISKGRKTFRIGELADVADQGDIYFLEELRGQPAFEHLVGEWDLFPNIEHDDHLDDLDILRRALTSGRRQRVGVGSVSL